MGSPLLLVFAVLLVVLNGFFVAAEFSLVKLRATRVKALAKTRGWRGRVLAKVHGNLDVYLSACQLGITLASLGLGWVGEPAFAGLLKPCFEYAGLDSETLVHGVSFVTAFFLISYLHIVVGELAPKSLALQAAEHIGLWTAPLLYAFYWSMYPVIWMLNQSSATVLRLLRIQPGPCHESSYSADELKLILRSTKADAGFTGEEWRILAQALDFRELSVADLMRPFSEAVTLKTSMPVEELMDRIRKYHYSRYPVLGPSNQLLGFIHAKDLLDAERPLDIEALCRPVIQVSASYSALSLFRRFQRGEAHLAVVTQPDGQAAGFLSMGNLLNALVGEITDEYRRTPHDWARLHDGSLLGKGSLPLFSLERALGIDLEDVGVESIGGLLQHRLGAIPVEGQRITFPFFDVVVKRMAGPRVVLVKVRPTCA